MSNIVPIKSHAVAALNSRLGAMVQTMTTPSFGSVFPRISTNKRSFSIVRSGEEPVTIKEGRNNVAELPVIVLAANPGVYKAWYEKKYVPGTEPEAPACFSSDGVKPHAASAKKQCDTCAMCPRNVFGSRVSETGKKAKECTDSKRLLVVSPKSIDGEVYVVNVSATALKAWNTYVKMLTRGGVYPQTVITLLSFNEDTDFPQLQFQYGGTLPAEVIEQVIARLDEDSIAEFASGDADTESSFVRKPLEAPEPAKVQEAVEPKAEPVEQKKTPRKATHATGAGGFGTDATVEAEVVDAPSQDDNLDAKVRELLGF